VNVLVVDTSSWISYFKNKHTAEIDLGLKEGRVHLAPIVLAELLSGKLKQTEKVQLLDFLKELPLCTCDFEHWLRVGELRATLLAKGVTISTPDAHVAQCTLDLDGYLATEDKIFTKIPSLTPLKLLFM
jgi:predicted nucleic acid-binding protein